MTSVDCVIVSYNSAADLGRCVESVRAQHGVQPSIMVVDNASADDSVGVAERLGVAVIRNAENRGFAAAVNRGVRGGTAPWVLVINPDAALADGALAGLVARAGAAGDVGCVGPRVVGSDGAEYPSGRRFPAVADAAVHALLGKVRPNNRATRRYHAADLDRQSAVDVDWVSGCCMFIPRPVWEILGGLDEAYFLYIEDMDFALRARRAGYRVVYEPAVEVVHHGGRSSRTRRIRSIYHHHVGAVRFQWRLSGHASRLLTFPLSVVFLAARFAVLAGSSWVREIGRRRSC